MSTVFQKWNENEYEYFARAEVSLKYSTLFPNFKAPPRQFLME